MVARLIRTAFILAAALHGGAALAANTSKGMPAASPKQWEQDWALSRCLAHAFPETPFAQDANRSAAIALENSKAPIALFEQIDALIDKTLAQPLGGSAGGSYFVATCIAFSRSPALLHLLRHPKP